MYLYQWCISNILVSPDDVDKLYHHFMRMDKDGNGVIDRQDLMNVPSIAENPLAGRLLDLFDEDESGDINFADFVTGLAIFSSKNSETKKLRCKHSICRNNLLLILSCF